MFLGWQIVKKLPQKVADRRVGDARRGVVGGLSWFCVMGVRVGEIAVVAVVGVGGGWRWVGLGVRWRVKVFFYYLIYLG